MVDIQIKETPLDVQACNAFVAANDRGGLVTFIGNVRNQTSGKPVLRLEFESYVPMALKEMTKIARAAIELHGVAAVSIHHRIGKLLPGETAVVIAVASGHRKESFSACQFAIDTLKETVPIWKKEVYENGEIWVAATP